MNRMDRAAARVVDRAYRAGGDPCTVSHASWSEDRQVTVIHARGVNVFDDAGAVYPSDTVSVRYSELKNGLPQGARVALPDGAVTVGKVVDRSRFEVTVEVF